MSKTIRLLIFSLTRWAFFVCSLSRSFSALVLAYSSKQNEPLTLSYCAIADFFVLFCFVAAVLFSLTRILVFGRLLMLHKIKLSNPNLNMKTGVSQHYKWAKTKHKQTNNKLFQIYVNCVSKMASSITWDEPGRLIRRGEWFRQEKLMNFIKRRADNWFGLRSNRNDLRNNNILIKHDYRVAC